MLFFSERNVTLIFLSLSLVHKEKGSRGTAPTHGRLFGEGKVSRPAWRELRNVTASKFDSRIAARERAVAVAPVFTAAVARGRDSGLEGREFLLPATSATHVHLYREASRASIPVRARAPPPPPPTPPRETDRRTSASRRKQCQGPSSWAERESHAIEFSAIPPRVEERDGELSRGKLGDSVVEI